VKRTLGTCKRGSRNTKLLCSGCRACWYCVKLTGGSEGPGDSGSGST